jgi:hypothetical protein
MIIAQRGTGNSEKEVPIILKFCGGDGARGRKGLYTDYTDRTGNHRRAFRTPFYLLFWFFRVIRGFFGDLRVLRYHCFDFLHPAANPELKLCALNRARLKPDFKAGFIRRC